MRAVDVGLTRGDTLARYNDGLHPHQEHVVVVDTGCRGNHHASGAQIHRDHRTRREGTRRKEHGEAKREEGKKSSHGRSPGSKHASTATRSKHGLRGELGASAKSGVV